MSVKIEKIEATIVDIPTVRPHILSMASINIQTMVIVSIHCSDSVVGFGEGATIGGLSYGEESPEGMKLAIDRYIAPLLIGLDPTNHVGPMAVIRRHVVGNHFAKNAVETALLDAVGKRLGVSVSTLLGGRFRDQLSVLWTLASGNTEADIEEAQAMIEANRHNTFKLKIGKRTLKDDIAHVKAIKKAMGETVSIRVDVNQAWDLTTAIRGAEHLADAGADLIEQPLNANDRRGMIELAQRSPIPIMVDEALRGPHDALEYANSRGAGIYSIKPAQAGGLFAARDVAAIGMAAGIGIYGGTMLEGSIGTSASAQLFSTLPRLDWGTELFGPLLQTEDILTHPLVYQDHTLRVPDGPGLGVTLDIDKVRFFQRNGAERTLIDLKVRETG